MHTFSPRIPVSLAFALIAAQAFAHAQLEKATPAVGGTVASANEIRLEFSEDVEPRFSGVTLSGAGGAAVPLGARKSRSRRRKGDDRPDRQSAVARRLYGQVARGFGRHSSHAGDIRIHGEMNGPPGHEGQGPASFNTQVSDK